MKPFHIYLETGTDLVLTELRSRDLAALCKHANDPIVYQFTENIPYPFEREDGLNYLAKVNRAEERYKETIHFAIRDRNSGELAGAILRLMTNGMDSIRDEIGYWLGEPWRGQGMMASCVRRFCQHWFEQGPIIRLTAVVHPENKASQRVLEKAGFKTEAFFEQFSQKDGIVFDVLQMVLLKKTFEAQQKPGEAHQRIITLKTNK